MSRNSLDENSEIQLTIHDSRDNDQKILISKNIQEFLANYLPKEQKNTFGILVGLVLEYYDLNLITSFTPGEQKIQALENRNRSLNKWIVNSGLSTVAFALLWASALFNSPDLASNESLILSSITSVSFLSGVTFYLINRDNKSKIRELKFIAAKNNELILFETVNKFFMR